MSFKSFLMEKSMGLLQNPQVAKLMQDERVMKAMMKAFETRGKVQSAIDTQTEALAKSLNLATRKEVRQLERTLRKVEQELAKARAESAGGKPE